ncbi:AraC family transcriptional regulator ligand-binding domain-containing protein [Streptomyces sp. NPDC008139]|uniref:AraC family transcriptional regulator ligand-binding domain-containing protein n=1 Tax=Streptomyces sp. NPDC008139 TaxID=3364814 RepID=UPI0036E63FAD
MPPTATPPVGPAGPAAPDRLTECVVVPRFIATAATPSLVQARQLVRAAGLPNVLHGPEAARTPSANTYRLWGAVLARTERPDAGLLAAADYRPGLLDLFDYLLSTAPTVGEGLGRAASYIHLVSSNSVLTSTESGDEVTVEYAVRRGDDELRGVVAEFALSVVTLQLRHATGTALTPLRVSFTHRRPRGHGGYGEAFGDAPVDFDAEGDAITLHRADLERPLATADPALAAIMMRTARTVQVPRADTDGVAVPGLREAIITQLPDGRPSLAEAARRLAVSPRTLQRRLGESGTTWRAELDAVRRERSADPRHAGGGSAQRAARLGFAESRSLRRAMNRWDARERETGQQADQAEQTEQDRETECDREWGRRA